MRVQKRARDYLGLMNDPAICFSVLGPSGSQDLGPGMVNWTEGSSKMVSHVPFYILNEQEAEVGIDSKRAKSIALMIILLYVPSIVFFGIHREIFKGYDMDIFDLTATTNQTMM
ncbi:hypothetical protein QJS10_CPB11g01263 [Acorus calamus]|uniref:Uncharacterized protein n=1 Tax=Acorus calamus TaxID=4465 RepID=A0AAV9DRT4_ACOCL|nr:hypothetical protein QJS10_CPB11g01263 [Acorus calamus]